MINTTLALRTTRYLAQERDFIPWESALRNLDYYILMLDRTEVYEALQASTASPGGGSSRGRCWTGAISLLVLPVGLPEEANPAAVPALQDHHGELDQDSSRTHGPVRSIPPLLLLLLLLSGSTAQLLSDLLRYNQVNAIRTACAVGEESCRELTRSWFRSWMENPRSNP